MILSRINNGIVPKVSEARTKRNTIDLVSCEENPSEGWHMAFPKAAQQFAYAQADLRIT